MTLTNDETIVLSFGLKFATGIRGADTADTVTKNYRFGDSDFTKAFIQDIYRADTSLLYNNSRKDKTSILVLRTKEAA